MRCNYCGSNYGELPDVAKDLWLNGCYECGARDFDSNPNTKALYEKGLLTANQARAQMLFPQVTSGSSMSIPGVLLGYYDPVSRHSMTGVRIDNHSFNKPSREWLIDYAVTGGSTGYFDGQYQDFSGFHIDEAEYAQYQHPSDGFSRWDSPRVPEPRKLENGFRDKPSWLSRVFADMLAVLD